MVSVIIPTYNRAKDVCAAIDSVLSQTYHQVELIVVDDGSSDNTAGAIAAYGDRVRYVLIPHSGLPARARNAGLAIAGGQYVAFLDSDDLWLPQKLEQQVPALDADPQVGLVCCNALVMIDDQIQTQRRYLSERQGQSGAVLPELIRDNFVINSTAVIRRSLLDQVGYLSENPALKALEDYDLWLRLAAVSDVCYLREPLAIYRDAPAASIRREQSPASYYQGMALILDRLQQLMAERRIEDRAARRSIATQSFGYRLALCRSLWRERRHRLALASCVSLLAHHPPLALRTVALAATASRDSPGIQLGSHAALSQPPGTPATSQTLEQAQGDSLLRLHLGCGEVYLAGYVNIDLPSPQDSVQRHRRVDAEADIITLSYPSGSVDEIRLHHVFEHFDRPLALHLLMNWYDWLRVGGRLTIETPDFHRSAQAFVFSFRQDKQAAILRHLYGSHEAPWAVHGDAWHLAKFKRVLPALGFSGLEFSRNKWRDTYNIIVTAVKTPPVRPRAGQIEACQKLLQASLIDHSETEMRMLAQWMRQLHDLESGHGSK